MRGLGARSRAGRRSGRGTRRGGRDSGGRGAGRGKPYRRVFAEDAMRGRRASEAGAPFGATPNFQLSTLNSQRTAVAAKTGLLGRRFSNTLLLLVLRLGRKLVFCIVAWGMISLGVVWAEEPALLAEARTALAERIPEIAARRLEALLARKDLAESDRTAA